jgi:23S rRNA (adenine2503-C2)-methyltransferase
MYQPGMKRNLLGLDQAEIVELVESLGEKPFRGKQLYHQIYRRQQLDFAEMTELSKFFRQRLVENFVLQTPDICRRSEASDGTVKYLFRLSDDRFIESVFIPEEDRDTLCISSQVGCNVGCTFCMTARMGLERNLKADEILGQVLAVVKERQMERGSYSIVFMGMGEPLQNYKNVMKAFRLMVDPQGMTLSHRKVTISTSGVVPVLRKMHHEKVFPNLAISLNATSNNLRDELMPLNRRWNLEELIQTCREFPLEPRRRIMFEYVLLSGINDDDRDAERLVRLFKGLRPKVNLIPYNPNPGLPYQRPSEERIRRFREILVDNGVAVFMRKTRGDDIAAACGQLAYGEKIGTNPAEALGAVPAGQEIDPE